MRWTEQQLADFLAKDGCVAPQAAVSTANPPFAVPRNFALGRLKTGEMNKTEGTYDAHLWQRRVAGEILWHKFEGVKLRLADNTFYTPDFAVLPADGVFEIHEVKGYWQDDARVKIKVAAALYPFRFIALTPRAKKNGGGYDVEQF